jgi:hypothetical protein
MAEEFFKIPEIVFVLGFRNTPISGKWNYHFHEGRICAFAFFPNALTCV